MWEIVCLILAAMGTLAAISFTLYIFFNEKRDRRLQRILDQNTHLLDLAIKYPYMEKSGYCAGWMRKSQTEEDIRYSLYCTEVFNVIEELFFHCNCDPVKMEKILCFQEYVKDHQNWWKQEIRVTGGYSDEFNDFIDKLITDMRKKEENKK